MTRTHSDTRSKLLEQAAELFAGSGFAAVSVRDIARTMNLTAAALYHHFTDKDSLYEAVLEQVYRSRTQTLHGTLDPDGQPAASQLRNFVLAFAEIVAGDKVFARLLHRELLDGGAARMQRLSAHVFQEPFSRFAALLKTLAPGRDPHLTANAMIAIILGHYEFSVIRQSMPGYLQAHENPSVLTDHVINLVLTGP